MTKAKVLALTAWALLLIGLGPEAHAQTPVCRIGDSEYESLSEAVEDVMSGRRAGEIELLEDCELNVGTIKAPVSISGGGHSISVPAQSGSENGALAIYSSLHVSDAALSFGNSASWSAVIGSQGELELTEGSRCSFVTSGIYASPGARISLDASEMTLDNMRYTCMMAEAYGELELGNGSRLSIAESIGINGITGFNINVDASELSVTGCPRQGLVKCSLTLRNGSFADISNNGTGYNLYSYNVLTVERGTSLRMNGNASAAILMQGQSTVNIASGGAFECRENGKGWTAANTDSAYGSKAAINIGWFNAQYIYTGGIFNVEDGADARISDNLSRAVTNYGKAYFGSGSVIADNGALSEGETASSRRIEHGGGVNNHGTLTLAEGAVLDNNHASAGADDIFNAEGGVLSLPQVAEGRRLDMTEATNDCGDPITGWFIDEPGHRWNAHDVEALFIEELEPGEYSAALELKAAHGELSAPPTGDGREAALWLALLMLASAGLLLLGKRIRGGR